MRSAIRLSALGLALFSALGNSVCECPGPPPCPDPPDCADFACQDDPACTPNGQIEDCDTPGDEDGDGFSDEQDPFCVDDVSPSDGTDCVGQNVTTTAGGDIDVLDDADDCDDPVGSDSGDGDTARVEVTEMAGVVRVEVHFTENGTGPSPTAEIRLETTTPYAAGGNVSIFSQLDTSNYPNAAMTTSVQSYGYTIVLDGSTRGWIPALPLGGSYTGDTTISVIGNGSPSSTFVAYIGTGLPADTDNDGVANAIDRFCPKSRAPVGACGCGQCGTYLDIDWGCDELQPAGQCFFNHPAPGFCRDCGVKVDGVVITASDTGTLRVETDGDVVCNECEATGRGGSWRASVRGAAEFLREASGNLRIDQRGGAYSFIRRWCFEWIGSSGGWDQVIVDRSAFDSANVSNATIEAATTDEDEDLGADFEIGSGNSLYEATIETSGGVGRGPLRLAFGSPLSVRWKPEAGWALNGVNCPHDEGTVFLDGDAACLYTFERQDTGNLILTTQIGIEIGNKVVTNFADLELGGLSSVSGASRAGIDRGASSGLGELFSVSGANGVGVYRADNFSLVPSLSEIGGFNLINVLGALFLNAPGFPNDGRFVYQIPSGLQISQYFPEIPGFGASLLGFAAVRDATYVDGDPNVGRGVFATSTGIQRLTFQDFGAEYPFLSSNPVVFGAPTGFSITSAFQTSASDQILYAARSNTAGANGQLFRWTGTTSVAVGDLAVDPRLLRCASAVPGTWICVAANYESGNVSVITWDGAGTAAVAGTLAVGPNPLVPGIAAANGQVHVLVPSFTGDTATALRLDGTTGAELARRSYPLTPGAAPSSALILDDASTGVVTLNGLDALQVIRNTFSF